MCLAVRRNGLDSRWTGAIGQMPAWRPSSSHPPGSPAHVTVRVSDTDVFPVNFIDPQQAVKAPNEVVAVWVKLAPHAGLSEGPQTSQAWATIEWPASV